MKLNLQEQLGILALEKNLRATESKLIEISMDLETEECPNLRRSLEQEYEETKITYQRLSRLWMYQ